MGNLRAAEFTSENLRDYAKRCVEIGMDLPGCEFDTLLIPSRGAVPVFLGSVYALKYLSKENKLYKNVLDKLTAPLTIKKGILPKAQDNAMGEDDIKVLPYPLTADINLTLYEPHANNDYYSTSIREGAVKTIKSFFKEPHERIEDPYFNFFSNILSKVEKRDKLALEYATYPRIRSMAMIDTVISGRAVATILNAFGEEGIHPEAFLVVDRSGGKVRKDLQEQLGYKKYDKSDEHFLYQKRMGRTIKNDATIDRRKIKFYEVNRIMTEDTGCALQGVSATVYPSLIIEGNRKLFPGLGRVAAGTWHALPRERSHRRIFYHFINTLKSAVNLECADLCGEGKQVIDRKEEIFEHKRENLIQLLETTRLPDIDMDNLGHYYPEYDKDNVKNVYESSAQVLHVIFNEDFTNYFLNEFQKGMGNISQKKEGLERLL